MKILVIYKTDADIERWKQRYHKLADYAEFKSIYEMSSGWDIVYMSIDEIKELIFLVRVEDENPSSSI